MARHLGVRYSSVGVAKAARSSEPGPLRPDALTTLPDELRRSLRHAVISLNAQQIHSLIEDVGRKDEALGCALAQRTNRHAYTPILTAIKRAELEPASPGRHHSKG